MLTSDQLHELRQAAGISIYLLADLAGVHWQTVLGAERGSNLRPETRARLEAALKEAVEARACRVAAARRLIEAA